MAKNEKNTQENMLEWTGPQRNNSADTDSANRHLKLIFALVIFIVISGLVDHGIHLAFKTSYGTYWDLLPMAVASTLVYIYGFRSYRLNDLILECVCLAILITAYVKTEPVSAEHLRVFARVAAQLTVKFILYDFIDNTLLSSW
ncbi:hypothetical protein HELRODRAFT_160025 [Helobdella robusta]|uniref:Uncharacterized protein n=1 Tax=Helobdella robusta TaxID=6412 RepID=T1EPP0_HELRO|nr:hypothetical protein HELRODRAFT_160025 [Helobdella robusta]ESO05929.1 hypothetical protein HELRODRAFT_160025 [Helobdella robusta]